MSEWKEANITPLFKKGSRKKPENYRPMSFTSGSRTRGHKAALVKEQCRLDMRKYSQRVINEWNKLPNDCVNASSVNMFKNRINRYLIRAGYTWMRKLLDSR